MDPAVKKLLVYWKLRSMSKDVAKKAQCQGGKHYTVELKRSEFPVDTDPEVAYSSIYDEFGRRPRLQSVFGVQPFPEAVVAHSFAEIVGHKIVESREPEQKEAPRMEQKELL